MYDTLFTADRYSYGKRETAEFCSKHTIGKTDLLGNASFTELPGSETIFLVGDEAK
jgi:hypothetical protein